jgi:hypothetical protein
LKLERDQQRKPEKVKTMSGRPRTTSFAEGNKQQPQVLGGMKVTSKYLIQALFALFNTQMGVSRYPAIDTTSSSSTFPSLSSFSAFSSFRQSKFSLFYPFFLWPFRSNRTSEGKKNFKMASPFSPLV